MPSNGTHAKNGNNGNGTKHSANGSNGSGRRSARAKRPVPSRAGKRLVDRSDPTRFAPPAPFAGAEKVKVGDMVPQPHGGALRFGNPGNKGSNGRPPDAFRQLCRELASGEKTIESVIKILDNPDHPQFVAALRWATEHGYGKPAQTLEHSGHVTLEQILARSYDE